MIRKFQHPSGRCQRLAVADLTRNGAEIFGRLTERPVHLIYSDPPWSPGNEKWWRRHARVDPPQDYNNLLRGWMDAVLSYLPTDVFCEQSANASHCDLLLSAIEERPDWRLPLAEDWCVRYGSPKRTNRLLHFGRQPLGIDPSGQSGVRMTRTVFEALPHPPGTIIGDPCIGKGMVSRLAHRRGWDCIGTELNPERLDKTIGWLLRAGYVEVSHGD